MMAIAATAEATAMIAMRVVWPEDEEPEEPAPETVPVFEGATLVRV